MALQNRLTQLFAQTQSNLLNVYFTAGYPQKESTLPVLRAIEEAGADLIEIGIPFSDPIADGPTIQASNQIALSQGMNLKVLFEQLKGLRPHSDIPVLLMGYLNPVMQYGLEKFCTQAAEVGVDGLILPDLPMYEYENEYKAMFDEHNLSLTFLITPETSEERIRRIDELSQGFIYAVSSSSTTGKTQGIQAEQIAYFQRLQAMKLKNPFLIGFGISDRESFEQAGNFAQGAIIGSAFIRELDKEGDTTENIRNFIQGLKGINK